MDSQFVHIDKLYYAGLVKEIVAGGCVKDARRIINMYKFL